MELQENTSDLKKFKFLSIQGMPGFGHSLFLSNCYFLLQNTLWKPLCQDAANSLPGLTFQLRLLVSFEGSVPSIRSPPTRHCNFYLWCGHTYVHLSPRALSYLIWYLRVIASMYQMLAKQSVPYYLNFTGIFNKVLRKNKTAMCLHTLKSPGMTAFSYMTYVYTWKQTH